MKSNYYHNTIFFMNFIACSIALGAERHSEGIVIASRSPIKLPTPTHEVHSDGTSSESDSAESKNSQHLNHEKINRVRTLSQPSLHKFTRKSKNVFDQKPHEPISRNYFNNLETVLSVLIVSAGAYKAYNFFTHRSERTEITRGGVPTDMIGAAFWGASKLSSIASSGFTLILAAYAGHKIKNMVDKLYENRFNKMLQPVIQDLEELAAYVDTRVNPLAEGQRFLCDVVEQVAQGQENLAQSQERLIIFMGPLIKDHQEEHPTNARVEELTPELQEMQAQASHTANQAHKIGRRIEEQKNRISTAAPVNPITSKTKSKNRCCGMC